MCIIAVKPSGVKNPKTEWLHNCEKINRDGIGIAFLKAGINEVVIKKDFLNSQALAEFIEKNIRLEDTLMIHFRLATHGLKDIGNRHPFPISTDKSLLRKPNLITDFAVAHNGIISCLPRHHKFSDTQKFVLSILSDKNIKEGLGTKAIDILISEFLGNDKLAILKYDGTLLMYGDFLIDEGIYFSNNGYKLGYYLLEDKSIFPWRSEWIPTRDAHYKSQMGKCEKCGKEKLLKYTEIDDGNYAVGKLICKTCRREIRKSNQTALQQCQNCFESFDGSQMLDSYYGKLCRKCHTDLYLGGL